MAWTGFLMTRLIYACLLLSHRHLKIKVGWVEGSLFWQESTTRALPFPFLQQRLAILAHWIRKSEVFAGDRNSYLTHVTFKIKHSKSKGMQEKESNLSIWCGQKIPSLGITDLHHFAKPWDAKQWPSGRNFLSAPHIHVRFLYSFLQDIPWHVYILVM